MTGIQPRSVETQTSQSEIDSEQRLLVIDQLTILGEAFGQQLTDERMRVYCSDLADLTVEQVKLGCWRSRRELKFFPKIAELRELAGALSGELLDGRPGVEQAWSMCPKSEEASVVWTEEMALAFGTVRPLIAEGDMIAARMAFKEVYGAELQKSRAEGRPVKWNASLGWDTRDRVRALSEAVLGKRIAADYAVNLLSPMQQEELLAQLPSTNRMLTGSVQSKAQTHALGQLLGQLRERNSLPEELEPVAKKVRLPEPSPEEWKAKKEAAKRTLNQLIANRAAAGSQK